MPQSSNPDRGVKAYEKMISHTPQWQYAAFALWFAVGVVMYQTNMIGHNAFVMGSGSLGFGALLMVAIMRADG